ncbi:MAG: aminomethyltransferase family protein, partial [Gammaproteobacteria bacterium]|nr:aminomethyltransferase family protein [Gammaproteobacteria bacterium]
LHIAGPESRSLLAKMTSADVSNESQPFLSGKRINLAGEVQSIALRVSFTGELGYELYFPSEHSLDVYHSIREAGEEFELRPVGSHALMSLRLEKSYPSWGFDLTSDYYPAECGMDRFVAMDKGDFIGRDALTKLAGPREKIATFEVDAVGADAYTGEPVFCNGELAGYVSSGGYGYRVDRSLALGYVTPDFYDSGNDFEIEIIGERRAAKMTNGATYDPTGTRAKA